MKLYSKWIAQEISAWTITKLHTLNSTATKWGCRIFKVHFLASYTHWTISRGLFRSTFSSIIACMSVKLADIEGHLVKLFFPHFHCHQWVHFTFINNEIHTFNSTAEFTQCPFPCWLAIESPLRVHWVQLSAQFSLQFSIWLDKQMLCCGDNFWSDFMYRHH